MVEYLKIFNFYSKSMIDNLKDVYNLCIAGVDLESFTIEKNSINPNLQRISKFGDETKVMAEQEIGLIGYGDSMSEHLKIFQSKYTQNAEIAVELFINHILERAEILRIKKEQKLSGHVCKLTC